MCHDVKRVEEMDKTMNLNERQRPMGSFKLKPHDEKILGNGKAIGI